jgi:hypothetical protein
METHLYLIKIIQYNHINPERRVHNLTINIGAISIFYETRWWHESSPIWRHRKKYSRYGDMEPGVCTSLFWKRFRLFVNQKMKRMLTKNVPKFPYRHVSVQLMADTDVFMWQTPYLLAYPHDVQNCLSSRHKTCLSFLFTVQIYIQGRAYSIAINPTPLSTAYVQ